MENDRELLIYRRLLALSGGVYLVWWAAVEGLLPGSFNPLLSRLFVVACIGGALAASYRSAWMRARLGHAYTAGVWLITAHYFYLFHGNGGDINWIVGAFITVTAISHSFFSSDRLLAYSAFVGVVSIAQTVGTPPLWHSVFLPGIFTLLIQANLGLRSRLKILGHLEESNARFQLLFDSTFEGILVHQNDRILLANQALAKMLGYPRNELIGRPASDILAPESRSTARTRMLQAQDIPYETVGLRRDGSHVELEVRGKGFMYGRRPARIAALLDIGDRKRAEQERVAAQAMSESVRIRDEFISIASHELKTPLTSLKLEAQRLSAERRKPGATPPPAERIDRFVALVNRMSDRLATLVDTMMDVSRISAPGQLRLETKTFDLADLARETVESLYLPAGMPAFELDLPVSLVVRGDPHRLAEVIENLLTNALKYGESRTARVRLRAEGQDAILSIADQGRGIAAEDQGRIFERFERAAPTNQVTGLGLGLYIARLIVEAHGGLISVESAPGSGATFTVVLRGAVVSPKVLTSGDSA